MNFDKLYEEAIKHIEDGEVYMHTFSMIYTLRKAQKEHELLGLYRNFQYHVYSGNVAPRDRLNEKIQKLEKEIEEMK